MKQKRFATSAFCFPQCRNRPFDQQSQAWQNRSKLVREVASRFRLGSRFFAFVSVRSRSPIFHANIYPSDCYDFLSFSLFPGCVFSCFDRMLGDDCTIIQLLAEPSIHELNVELGHGLMEKKCLKDCSERVVDNVGFFKSVASLFSWFWVGVCLKQDCLVIVHFLERHWSEVACLNGIFSREMDITSFINA